ncbi:UbiE/COQ5 methyltransferase [Diaporthe amygdali]|uniref:UbiE/COQ5 methyltransferase n=1 Tax=Phomopsis amygdali TaxID=1214568 RepID=UPI0022FEFBB8|nr:UbiE/COQ5 methyltransferase [Diaporthe amygdali]KAJ0107264.1 UbiE/COQ5 methyltransferase [Diaporthe amygdali]
MAYQQKALVSDDPDLTTLYEFRNAKDYAAYLLPHIKPDFHILDVGSGPGRMTHDFSLLVPHGKVVGIDISPGILAEAAAKYQEPNLSFELGDAYELSQFADASFDVIHAHAVIMHLPDPIKAFKAMYRVVKPGGIVATRDPSGRGIVSIIPDRPPFTELMTEASPAQMKYIDAVGSFSQFGLHKEKWAREAGFGERDGGKIEVRLSYEHVTTAWNLFRGSMADQAVRLGIITQEQVTRWADIWSEWTKEEDRLAKKEFVDMLCFKGKKD